MESHGTPGNSRFLLTSITHAIHLSSLSSCSCKSVLSVQRLYWQSTTISPRQLPCAANKDTVHWQLVHCRRTRCLELTPGSHPDDWLAPCVLPSSKTCPICSLFLPDWLNCIALLYCITIVFYFILLHFISQHFVRRCWSPVEGRPSKFVMIWYMIWYDMIWWYDIIISYDMIYLCVGAFMCICL